MKVLMIIAISISLTLLILGSFKESGARSLIKATKDLYEIKKKK